MSRPAVRRPAALAWGPVVLLSLVLGLLAGPAWAQPAGEAGAAQGASPASSGASGQEAPRGDHALMEAYKKEYAFLEKQKRELDARLRRFRQQTGAERARAEKTIDSLSERVVALDEQASRLRENIEEAERAAQTNRDNRSLLDATFEQAGVSLADHGRDVTDREAFQALADEEKVATLFRTTRDLLTELASVRSQEGSFFLPDGARTQGRLVLVGEIAAYGVSEEGSGVLAPAGGGDYKVWAPEPRPGLAEAMAAGDPPGTLGLFLYESLDKAVAEDVGDTVLEYIQSGGIVAWIIVVLGALAVLLILLRIFFLKRASTSTRFLVTPVGDLVRAGEREEALETCKRRHGSAARVVAAAVRNLDRDRGHLEDIIAEAILNESGRLERFGTLIIMIAAVSPLLGLLGTVTGMIATFEVITEFGTGDPKLLSGGISTALVTTQLGLMVAIPTLLIGNLLSAWGERIKDDVEKAALAVTNIATAPPAEEGPEEALAGA
mgnify:CR=1 FL=1